MLSQGTGYAATALAYVAAGGGRPVLVREIAEATDLPAPYLAKLVHALAKRGIVGTQRGIGGGVTLARAAQDISLHDLCEALGDPVLQRRCMLGTAECSDERACPAHKFWVAQRVRAQEYLRSMTIADVAAFETKRRWRSQRSAEPDARIAPEETGASAPGPRRDGRQAERRSRPKE